MNPLCLFCLGSGGRYGSPPRAYGDRPSRYGSPPRGPVGVGGRYPSPPRSGGSLRYPSPPRGGPGAMPGRYPSPPRSGGMMGGPSSGGRYSPPRSGAPPMGPVGGYSSGLGGPVSMGSQPGQPGLSGQPSVSAYYGGVPASAALPYGAVSAGPGMPSSMYVALRLVYDWFSSRYRCRIACICDL